jgi:diketogulonate reductase-like aldo/keto reductase
LAAKYNKKPGQIILNWHLSRGHVVIPKTTNVARLTENIDVFNFKLTDDEYKSVTALNQNTRFYNPKYFIKDYGWNFCPYFD